MIRSRGELHLWGTDVLRGGIEGSSIEPLTSNDGILEALESPRATEENQNGEG